MSYAEDLCEKSLLLVFKDCTGLIKNYRPASLKNPRTGCNLEIDLYMPRTKIGFEIQGQHHYENYDQKQRDQLKLKLASKAGITLIVLSLSQIGPVALHKVCKKVLYPDRLRLLHSYSADWVCIENYLIKPHLALLKAKYGKQECLKSHTLEHDKLAITQLVTAQFKAHLSLLPIVRAEDKGKVFDVRVLSCTNATVKVQTISSKRVFYVRISKLLTVNQSLMSKLYKPN